ncbi:MAG: hypothetical protein ACRD0U_06580, partial [Acidimicrobiales bacterium]
VIPPGHAGRMSSLHRAARFGGSQRGALKHGQAINSGLSQDEIDGLIERGVWRRPARGVYVVAGVPPSWQLDLSVALLAAGPGAVASHLTAGAVLGLWRPAPRVPHIIVPRTHSARLAVAKVHRSILAPGERLTVTGLACTSATRFLADVAPMLTRRELEHLVDECFCQGLSCVEAVRDSLDRRRGRRGAAVLREVIAAWTPGIEPGSPAEMRLFRLLGEWGYDEPAKQVEVRAADGSLVGRLDLGWVPRRVGLDYDSDRYHNPRFWADNERRYAAFKGVGWTVRSVSKSDLMPSSDFRTRLDAVFRAAAA